MSRKVRHFDICKAMAVGNLDIKLSPLSNVTNLNFRPKQRGTDVTIGVDGDVVAAIGLENRFIGGLLLIDRKQYFETKARLESETSPVDALVSALKEAREVIVDLHKVLPSDHPLIVEIDKALEAVKA